MAATNRLYVDAVSGTTDADPGVTNPGTLSGAFLADLPVVADPDFVALTLDPEEANGAYEIVWVTAHTASATTATIARAKEGTSVRAHPSGTKVVAALTEAAITDLSDSVLSHASRHASGAADPLTAGGVSLSMLVASVQEALVPVGTILAFGGDGAPPDSYLRCNGTAKSRTTYADLFAVIGTAYGAGDGSTTFNTPDLRQHFPMGKAFSGTGSVFGGSGGAIDHAHSGPSHVHSGPAHSHTQRAHTHVMNHHHDFSGSTGGAGGHAHTMGTHAHTMGTHSHTFSDSFTTGTESTTTATAAFGTESPGLAQDNHTHSGSVSGSTSAVDPGDTGATDPGDTGAVLNHDHSYSDNTTSASWSGTGNTDDGVSGGSTSSTQSSGTANTGSAGTGSTGGNNPPFVVVNYIIKA